MVRLVSFAGEAGDHEGVVAGGVGDEVEAAGEMAGGEKDVIRGWFG